MASLEPVPITLRNRPGTNQSAVWQELQGVYRFAQSANLKVKFHPICASGPHFGNCLPDLDLLSLPNQKPAVMTVGTNVGFIVLDDYEFTVAPQATTGVHHRTIRRCKNRLSQIPGDINAFIQTTV